LGVVAVDASTKVKLSALRFRTPLRA
jgi:hypothetical protein